jgi:hypothetical protein
MLRVLLCGWLVLAISSIGIAKEHLYDVVVYGGTPGGVIAAVAAAREGADVLLLEQKKHVGGLNTSGLVNDETQHMQFWPITGLAREFYDRLTRAYNLKLPPDQWVHQFDSSVAQKVFDQMLAEAKIPVRYTQRVERAIKDGPRIQKLVMLDGGTVAGKVFIDATYEGDLMARSGVRYTWGREARAEYGEPLAGVQLENIIYRTNTRAPNGDLLPGINATLDQLNQGDGDRKVMNYNFRLCFMKNPKKTIPIPKPKNYNPTRYQLLANYLAEHPNSRMTTFISLFPKPGPITKDSKVEVNDKHVTIISICNFGGQFDYPDADYRKQDEIYQDFVDFTQGFLYFLGHDPSVPEAIRKETLSWGLAKDEFADNGNWPYYLYIREARRMLGDYVMTQKDVDENRRKPDSIALGSHAIDSHLVQRVAVNDRFFVNEGRIWQNGKVYEIPYRCITPKRAECANLLVPVAASYSHVAYCTLRVEPTWMATGHGAGVAAALAAQKAIDVQAVEIPALQDRLRAGKQLLSLEDQPRDPK